MAARPIERAMALNAQGRLGEAEAACRAILRAHPKDNTARHLLGVVLCRAGRLAEGERVLRQVVAAAPGNADALRHLGDCLHAQGRFGDAADILARLAALAPRDALAHLGLAVSLHAGGRAEQALAAYLRAIELDPTQADACLGLGDALCDLGRHDEAQAAYARALELRPDWPEALTHAGLAVQQAGRLEDAAALHRRAVEVRPGFVPGWTNLGGALQRLGRCGEALAAFQRAAALAPGDPLVLSNLAQAMDEAGEDDEAGLAVHRRATAADPGNADSHFGLGNALYRLGRHAEAAAAYGDALWHRPDWPEALTNAGLAALGLERLDEAEGLCRRAVDLRSDHAVGWTNLGAVLQRLGRSDEALAAFETAAALVPEAETALPNLAQGLDVAGRDDEAMEAHRRAVAANPDCAVARFNRGVALLRRGEYREGWRDYAWRWRGGVATLVSRGFPQPEWGGEDLAGRTLLLHAEQGFGDTLQFVRFVRHAAGRGGRVVLEVQPALAGLLRRGTGADVVVAAGQPLPPFDLHLPLMSLPGVLDIPEERFAEDCPYLAADPAGWRVRLGRGGIGLVWSGNPAHRADRQRSLPAALMVEALAASGRPLFGLQKETREADRAALAALTDLGPDFRDFADTAAAIACLDLVITVDTAVAHLAGALGRPVWLLLPHVAEWRWLRGRTDTPWYPTMRLFRQDRPGDWAGVLDRVAAELG